MKTPPERDRWRRVRMIFGDAAELPPGDRNAFLSRACHGDLDLRARVEALLAADSEAADFLNAPVEEYAAELVAELEDQEPTPTERLEDRLLGPYRIVGQIGRGGMGEVFEAYDTRLDRRVAIKLLPREWSQEPEAKERFRREARAASTLDHPNICTVYDLGETDGDGQTGPRLFIVLAHYQGETLADRIARGPLTISEARDIAIQIACGLERAHAAGVVHRDIKPANVMLTGDNTESDRVASDRVKILDFGIARIAGDASLTRTNNSPGTPAYMSPEQVRGDPADHRSDIWSLGVVLYEMLASQRPFRGDSAQASIYATLHHDPPPLRGIRSQVPTSLERVIAKAMAKDPTARYQRATDLLTSLDELATARRLAALGD